MHLALSLNCSDLYPGWADDCQAARNHVRVLQNGTVPFIDFVHVSLCSAWLVMRCSVLMRSCTCADMVIWGFVLAMKWCPCGRFLVS